MSEIAKTHLLLLFTTQNRLTGPDPVDLLSPLSKPGRSDLLQEEAANYNQQQNQWRSFMDWDQRTPSQSMQTSSSSMLHQSSSPDAVHKSRYFHFSSIFWQTKSKVNGYPDPSSQVKLKPCYSVLFKFSTSNKRLQISALF